MNDVTMTLTDASEAESDTTSFLAFLAFLADDIALHPERLQAFDAAFMARLRTLTDGVGLDLEAPLSSADE